MSLTHRPSVDFVSLEGETYLQEACRLLCTPFPSPASSIRVLPRLKIFSTLYSGPVIAILSMVSSTHSGLRYSRPFKDEAATDTLEDEDDHPSDPPSLAPWSDDESSDDDLCLPLRLSADDVEELRSVTFNFDSRPFFEKALEVDHLRGDADDTEGRSFSDDDTVAPPPAVSEPSPPVEPSTPVQPVVTSAKEKRKMRSKARRAAQAAKHKLLYPNLPRKYRPRLGTLRLLESMEFTRSNIRSEILPAAAGCWVGKRLLNADKRLPTVRNLLKRGMKLFEWDGITPHAFLDEEGRIIAVLAGKPSEADWDASMEELSKTLNEVRNRGKVEGVLKSSEFKHRRGSFFALPTGVSFGTGQKRPGNLKNTVGEQRILEELKRHSGVRRVVGFQHTSFAMYAPKLYAHYLDKLGKLYANQPNLRPNFPDISPYPAMTFNLGPDTATLEHTDSANVAYGWCSITALGKYDPFKEGHMVLYDLGIFVTFPPGSTILIPSAVFRHGNTPIVKKGSYRQSITQYCSGGLMRWVRYGFKTVKKFLEANPDGVHEIDGDIKARTAEALSLLSTVDSLQNDRVKILRT